MKVLNLLKAALITLPLIFIGSPQEVRAGNNDIAFISPTGYFCSYIFRDTAGSRTFTPNSYFWDFGDGNTTTSQHAFHDYLVDGTYTVTHIISNGTQSDTATHQLIINCRANLPFKAYYSYYVQQDTGLGTIVRFRCEATGRPTKIHWEYGDDSRSFDQWDAQHVYSVSDTNAFLTYLAIEDAQGNKDTTWKWITVGAQDTCLVFTASYIYEYDDTCNKMNFTNYSHYTATSFYWDFGDGTFSTLRNPSHQYDPAFKKTYDVKLTAFSNRCIDSNLQMVPVRCRTCFIVTADIRLEIDSTNPSKAVLYNHSTGPIGAHFWDFGDGQTSTLASPMHVYTSPGPITLRYVVQDTGSCRDTAELYFEIDSNGHIKRGNISLTLQVVDRTNGQTSLKTQVNLSNSLRIYPQPASESLQIENRGASELEYRIYNAIGTKVFTGKLDSGANQSIDISDWNTGIYYLRDQRGEVYKLSISR